MQRKSFKENFRKIGLQVNRLTCYSDCRSKIRAEKRKEKMSDLSQEELKACCEEGSLEDWSPFENERNPEEEGWILVKEDEYDTWYDKDGQLMDCVEAR